MVASDVANLAASAIGNQLKQQGTPLDAQGAAALSKGFNCVTAELFDPWGKEAAECLKSETDPFQHSSVGAHPPSSVKATTTLKVTLGPFSVDSTGGLNVNWGLNDLVKAIQQGSIKPAIAPLTQLNTGTIGISGGSKNYSFSTKLTFTSPGGSLNFNNPKIDLTVGLNF